MSSDPERTPEEFEPDPELTALLREVARPAPAALQVAPHVRAPDVIGVDAEALTQLAGLTAEGEPRPGDVLDRHYRIDRELGRGGMGVVYEAHNLHTGKRVALKWMSVQAGLGPERVLAMSRRFRREARAAACIRHPNVVDIYDVAGTDGAPFLVMELLEGEPLRARMKRSRTSWEEALRLILPVLRGVAAMHRAGVIHRDLKPDNIFICQRTGGDEPLPKVLDFGVAAMQDSGDGLGSLTRSGALLGTPSYMPLEQLTGKEIDARTDLYALGVVLYEMLTGELPFACARGAGELAVLQVTTRPASPALACPELRGAREEVLLKALARERADRFETAEAFADALLAARPGAGNRSSRPRGLAYVALGVAIAGGMLAFWRSATASLDDAPTGWRAPPPVSAVRTSAPSERVADPLPPMLTPPATLIDSAVDASAERRPGRARRAPRARHPTELSVEDF